MSDADEARNEKEVVAEEPIPITKKDPRKVEQGKRLAMISKEAKERKMRARLKEEMDEDKSWKDNIPKYVAIGSSVGLGLAVLYIMVRKPREIVREVRVASAGVKKVNSEKNKFEEL